ncbi:MAG TPA: hypothetical protein VGP22_05910, partial [Albitalea sp.]|nr:hypothetical protein [Albitalea sp.]
VFQFQEQIQAIADVCHAALPCSAIGAVLGGRSMPKNVGPTLIAALRRRNPSEPGFRTLKAPPKT